MTLLVTIQCHHLEPHDHFEQTLRAASWAFHRGYDVVAVFDRLPEWWRRYRWIKSAAVGPGLGHARDFSLRWAVEYGYSHVMFLDCHHRYVDAPDLVHAGLLRERMWNDTWAGNTFNFETLNYYTVKNADWMLSSMNTAHVYATHVIAKIMDAKGGYAILTPGFGYETHEISLSANVLGYTVCVQDKVYEHTHYSERKESWNKRWNDTQLRLFWESIRIFKRMIGTAHPSDVDQSTRGLVADDFCRKYADRILKLKEQFEKQYNVHLGRYEPKCN